MKRLALLIPFLALAGCANPFAQYYQGRTDIRSEPAYVASASPVQVVHSNNFERDVPAWLVKGYGYVGQSNFVGPAGKWNENQIREQANAVGAHLVLLNVQDAGTSSGAVPLTMPQTSITTGTSSATAFGSNGSSATAFGNSTSTTTTNQTVLMPYTVQRTKTGAVYLARVKSLFGAVCDPLGDDDRKRLETNQGVKVKYVVEGSPAFLADIVKNDIILYVGDDRVQTVPQYQALLRARSGQNVVFKLNRDGKLLEKSGQLGSSN